MRSVIQELRDMVPLRALSDVEAMSVAERQANRMHKRFKVDRPPFPESAITQLPKIEVTQMNPSPVSGAAHWARGRWLIVLNGAESVGRQRYSLAHEFKHVLDSPFMKIIYPHSRGTFTARRIERDCDYFAACLLMPRAWLLGYSSSDGLSVLRQLARRFGVSQTAMYVRLKQLENFRSEQPGPKQLELHADCS